MTPAEFEAEWARCAQWIDAARLHGAPQSLEQIKEGIVEGRYQFWPAVDAAVITQVVRGVRPELNIYLAGGALERLRDMLPVLELYGRSMECVSVTILGRVGWQRTFLTKEMGYKLTMVQLEKPIHG